MLASGCCKLKLFFEKELGQHSLKLKYIVQKQASDTLRPLNLPRIQTASSVEQFIETSVTKIIYGARIIPTMAKQLPITVPWGKMNGKGQNS